MKKIFIICLFLYSILGIGQELNDVTEIINLAKIYRGKHGLSNLSENKSEDIFGKYRGSKFEKVARYIQELSKKNNNVTDEEFLSRPDAQTLKLFHTIIMINYNMYESNPEDNELIVEEFLKKEVSVYEQIQQYYGSLFVSIVNKNRPFDYSNMNWDLNEIGLKDDKEKAVFFLIFIDKLCSQISNYHNAYRGPNWDGIEKYAGLLPQINGIDYFEFDSFYFKDFEMTIYKKKRYFKEYYLPKFYKVLISHLLMMEEKNKERKEINHFLLTSILSKQQYYEYCNNMEVINHYFK